MIGTPETTAAPTAPQTKVQLRREERTAEIVSAAWKLAREEGVAGISLHGVAREVGMRQPSLYSYFDSKHALYDAMFADGNRRLLARIEALDLPDDPREALKVHTREFVQFSLDHPEVNPLLFQRTIPGFEPSASSYALAQQVLDGSIALMRAAGITDPGDIDCSIAMIGGLLAAQLSNEPGGDRWVRHLDRLVDLFVDDAHSRSAA
ncbi:MAG: TetR/AcrR family transcriptional regulator [Acidimicrobiia bacterium]